MKNRIIQVLFAGVVLLTTACVREFLVAPETATKNCLTARMEFQPDTKTALSNLVDGMYYPLWTERDSLSVFTSTGQEPASFTLTSGVGESIGIFEGPRSGDRYVALFPYDAKAQWEGNSLTFNLPHVQHYQPDSFSLDGYPMIAVSETADLQFKNLCSIIRISITGSGVVGSIVLHSDSHFLSGPASIDLTYKDIPALEMKEGGSHDVRLECSAVMLDKTTAKDFYIVVPSDTYDGLTITVDAYTEQVTKSISHEVSLNRSELRPVTPFMVEAPMIDLDKLPMNQIWYKTKSGEVYSPPSWTTNQPFNVDIVSNTYGNGYGIIICDGMIKEVKDYAFNPFEGWPWNSEICELHFPDSVELIGQQVLPSLPSFRIPGRLISIGSGNLFLLDAIYGPLVVDGHGIVSEGVLLGVVDKNLEEYTTPTGVHTLSKFCFDVTSLKKVVISEGVRQINDFAFQSSSIEELYLPESIEVIGPQMLYKIKGFYGSSHCISKDNVCLINPRSAYGPEIVSIVANKEDEIYTIQDGIRALSTSFNNWPNLKRVVLPESLVRISCRPIFSECPSIEGLDGPKVSSDGRCFISYGTLLYCHDDGLVDYTIPPEAQCIYAFNFFNSEIKNLVISEGTKDIDYNCFEDSHSLRTVSFPTTIKFIGSLAFQNDNQLESIYLPVRVPPVVKGAPSDMVLPNLKVYVPEESYEDYMADPVWNNGWGRYLTPYHFDNIDSPVSYESTDYSQDGMVTVLQTATEGNGIDLIFMGNDFSDRQIADGTYLSTMETTVEAFFEVEPYKSFRHLFNVYVVNIVSKYEDSFPSNFVYAPLDYLKAQFDKCVEYASKAIPDNRMDEATVAMVCNSPYLGVGYFGICTFLTRDATPLTDYGSGLAVSVFPTTEMKALVKHETGGHGFGKLDDEYSICGAIISDETIELKKEEQNHGYFLNVDFTTDVSQVRWAKFLSDPRYEKELLGIYEGAGVSYGYGIYRPSMRSLMQNDCQGGYNAPSREAIYYRIHKLAYGADWEYDYEKFVEYDQGAKNIRPTSVDVEAAPASRKAYEVRDPLPAQRFRPEEWTVTVVE